MKLSLPAGLAELVDAADLKSAGLTQPYRFDSGTRYQRLLWFHMRRFFYGVDGSVSILSTDSEAFKD